MNFEIGKMYILRFFYTGTDFNRPTSFAGLTAIPRTYIDKVFNSDDFDEGFVVITEYKKEDF